MRSASNVSAASSGDCTLGRTRREQLSSDVYREELVVEASHHTGSPAAVRGRRGSRPLGTAGSAGEEDGLRLPVSLRVNRHPHGDRQPPLNAGYFIG